MSNHYKTRVFYIDDRDLEIKLDVIVDHEQPAYTRIYKSGVKIGEGANSFKEISLGNGHDLSGKKVKVHTSVQDKMDNTDDIFVKTLVKSDENSKKAIFIDEAEEEGDLFDLFTEIIFI